MKKTTINLNDDEVAVIKVIIGETEWFVPVDEWDLAIEEGRTKAITYNDSIRFVTPEIYDAMAELSKKMK